MLIPLRDINCVYESQVCVSGLVYLAVGYGRGVPDKTAHLRT